MSSAEKSNILEKAGLNLFQPLIHILDSITNNKREQIKTTAVILHRTILNHFKANKELSY